MFMQAMDVVDGMYKAVDGTDLSFVPQNQWLLHALHV